MSDDPSLWYLYKDAVLSHFNTLKENAADGPREVLKGIISIGYGLLLIGAGILLITLLVTSPIWVPVKHLRRAYKAKSVIDKDSTNGDSE